MRRSIRSIRKPHTGRPACSQPRPPEAWKVATTGQRAQAIAAVQMTGVIGSCRWSTSNRSRSSTCFMRGIARGLRTMFGSAPLAGTITERPTGITSAGGSAVPPVPRVQHAREAPRRVVAHHVRVSIP